MNTGERIIHRELEGLGFTVLRNGWPDFLALKNGVGIGVEVKASRDCLTRPQKAKRLADGEGYDRIVINVAPYEHGIGYGQWTHVDGWSEAALSYVATMEDLAFDPAASEED